MFFARPPLTPIVVARDVATLGKIHIQWIFRLVSSASSADFNRGHYGMTANAPQVVPREQSRFNHGKSSINVLYERPDVCALINDHAASHKLSGVLCILERAGAHYVSWKVVTVEQVQPPKPSTTASIDSGSTEGKGSSATNEVARFDLKCSFDVRATSLLSVRRNVALLPEKSASEETPGFRTTITFTFGSGDFCPELEFDGAGRAENEVSKFLTILGKCVLLSR